MTPEMVAPYGLILFLFLFLSIFMDHVQTKNHNYQPQDEKKFGSFINMYTH
jgi:hypothetical protein